MDKHGLMHYSLWLNVNSKHAPRSYSNYIVHTQNCKAIRENLVGDNLHHEQGSGIPEDLDNQYYYHPECFKKHDYAKTLAKRKASKDACELSRSKGQRSSNERWLSGDNCMICKMHQITVGHKFQLPKKLLTLDAENNIKKAAEMTEDEELLLEITGVDLVVKEFKRHDECYRTILTYLMQPRPKHLPMKKVILKT